MSGSTVNLGDSSSSSLALSRYGKLRTLGSSGDRPGAALLDNESKVCSNNGVFGKESILNYESSYSLEQRLQNGVDDRDKTPTAHLASPPPAAESNTTQSTISRLENKYADILNKIARRKRQELNEEDESGEVTATKTGRSRVDREKTLEAENSAPFKKSSIEVQKDDGSGGFAGLSKSATVIHVPQEKKSAITTKTESKYVHKEDKAPVASESTRHAEKANGSATKPIKAERSTDQHNGHENGETLESYLSRYKGRNERDTSNRYKDTSELIESLKAQPAKTNYNHYGHYDAPGADPVSSYYKSRYNPEANDGVDAYSSSRTGTVADKPSSSSSASIASRRTKSYRTRKEASRERKHLTMKLSAVNMDIDSPSPAASSATKPSAASASSSSGRMYKQYGAARKSQGTGLTSGGGYQRSQTQKLLYNFDDDEIYHPPTQRDNKRKEIQNVIRKYAQYDDDEVRRTTTNPYSSKNPLKSATSANLAYLSGGAGSAASGGGSGAHLYSSDRRDPIAEHYGLGSSYYPRSHYGYEYPTSYGSSALARSNPYSAAALNPYNPLSKTHSSAAVYNSGYLGGGTSAAQSAAAAAQRSRKNLMSFVRVPFVGVVDV